MGFRLHRIMPAMVTPFVADQMSGSTSQLSPYWLTA